MPYSRTGWKTITESKTGAKIESVKESYVLFRVDFFHVVSHSTALLP